MSRAQGREFLVSPINTKVSLFIEGVGKIIIFYFEENSLIFFLFFFYFKNRTFHMNTESILVRSPEIAKAFFAIS